MREKTKFCNFIYSNPKCKIRNKFFSKLSQYKKVDAAGKLFNNIEGTIEEITGIKNPKSPEAKVEFIRPYKFTIAFENSSAPGYTTEKIIHPMMARSIPIYWGNKIIDREFNNKSFLSLHEFANMDSLIKEIIKIDQDDQLYLKYLKEPYFYNNQPNKYYDLERIKLFFDKILKTKKLNRLKWREKINVLPYHLLQVKPIISKLLNKMPSLFL